MQWMVVLGFGMAGVGSRFAIDQWIAKWSLAFPVGTFAMNVAGSLLAGSVYGYCLKHSVNAGPVQLGTWSLGIVVGFCGGFTTFSGFALQLVQMIGSGKLGAAIAYALGSVVLCLLAVALGISLSRTLA